MATAQDEPGERRLRLSGVLAIVVMLGFLGAAAVVAWYVWHSLVGVTISTFGVVALTIGIGVTVLLGAGLTTLLIVSSRRGFDEGADRES
jgi:hypothetical protein